MIMPTLEQRLDVWEDKREIRNLMGRFAHTIIFKEEETIFETYWSRKQEDVCYGTNEGWYVGRDAVKKYFYSIYARTIKADEIIKGRFPDKVVGMPEDARGLGTVDVKALSSDLVEVAEDGKTAKGIWYHGGQDTLAEEIGPLYYYTFGVYAVDFIRENDEWKIWHMDYQEEIRHPMGQKWWEPKIDPAPFPEFVLLSETPITKPNYPEIRREYYHLNREFKEFPPVPEPYKSFADTFSYGK